MKRLAKKALNKLRRYLIVRQVRRAALPPFAAAPIVRRRYTFAGKVQKVGFRFELAELAKRLGLVGWCCNLPGGEVLAELQGEAARIDFLVGFMHSLKRIRIDTMQIEELAVDEQTSQFLISG